MRLRLAAGREETGVPLSTSGSSSAMSRDDDASKTMKSEEKDRKGSIPAHHIDAIVPEPMECPHSRWGR